MPRIPFYHSFNLMSILSHLLKNYFQTIKIKNVFKMCILYVYVYVCV